MQCPQQLLRRKETVSDNPRKKRSHDCPNRRCPVREPDFSAFELQRLREVPPHCDEPRPPDELVQKYHDPQPEDHEWGHWRSTFVTCEQSLTTSVRQTRLVSFAT